MAPDLAQQVRTPVEPSQVCVVHSHTTDSAETKARRRSFPQYAYPPDPGKKKIYYFQHMYVRILFSKCVSF
jgi:hypothetical protein